MAKGENVVVRCLDCGDEGECTTSVYNSMIKMEKHHGHKIRFVDKETGEVLAKSLPQALKDGLIAGKGMVEESGGMLFSDQGEALIPMEVLMPASALATYFKLKQNGLSSHKTVMSCLWEYAQFGIMKAHNLGLTLAPVEVAPQADDGSVKESIDKLTNTMGAFLERLGGAVPAAQAAGSAEATESAEADSKGGS